MSSKGQNKQEERILILTPTGRDAAMTERVLKDAGLHCEICDSDVELCRKAAEKSGLIFLTGEALTPETMAMLTETLQKQPPWSDIPLIVLTSGGSENPSNAETLSELAEIGNVTLIERPVRLMTLISAVKSALRARRKQYDARNFLSAELQAKEALRQSEERLRVALDAAYLGAWQLDLEAQKLECTEICKANFGLSPEAEFSYQRLLELIHPDDRERVISSISQSIEKRENYRAEYRVVWEDGSLHWILASGMANYLPDGKPYNMVGVTLDITQRKLAEEQREELLEREQSARAAAESANRLKDEFLATVSHELRTPLNAMLGWTSLLRSGQLSPKDAERALETVQRNARTQAEIIEDLLDVSRIITGKLSLETQPIDPTALVRAVIESLQPAANAKEITVRQITTGKLNPIMGDPSRVQQIVWNLLSNAIKFTPEGGEVEVKLEPDNTCLLISVRDTGQGINPNFLPFVFDRFLQADGTTTRSYGGLGLGLSIVKHLVELHGGTVKAESDGQDRGAIFTVKLPFIQGKKQKSKTNGHLTPDKDAQLNNASGKDLSGLKILVVEDEVDSLELITVFLEKRGAEVVGAKSMTEALEHLNNAIPDILISDIGMPDADGYEFIQNVRRLEPERGGKVPAVALTAYARAEDKTRALQSGFQTHLPKPVEMDKLADTIAEIAGRN